MVLSDGLLFHYGEVSCSWAQLRHVINIRKLTSTQLGQLGDTPAGLVWANANILESLVTLYGHHRAADKLSLYDCLLATRIQNATDAHDCIYGFLGLTSASDLVPDYTMPLNELYRNAFRHVIEHEQSPDILSLSTVPESASRFKLGEIQHGWYQYIGHNNMQALRQENIIMEFLSPLTLARHDPSLDDCINPDTMGVVLSWVPSWLPYWPLTYVLGTKEGLITQRERSWYNATRNSEPQVRFEGDMLVVRGFKLGEIISTTG